MASKAHHERSSSSPPTKMNVLESRDKQPKQHHSHHQSHPNIPDPLPTITNIISINKIAAAVTHHRKTKTNNNNTYAYELPPNQTNLRHESSRSQSTDPYSYARHLKKPLPAVPQLPQLPQQKEVAIELMVNSQRIYEQDIEPQISESDSYHNNQKTDEKPESDDKRQQCICNIKCITRFICNPYIKARCLLLFCYIFLIFICFMFGIAQIYDIQLNDELYIDDNFNVNKNVLFSNDKQAFSEIINYKNNTYEPWCWLTVFCIFFICFLFCFLYFLWIFLVDFVNFVYGIYDIYDDDRIYRCFKCSEKNKCSKLLMQYNYICGLDVAMYVFSLIVKNIFVLTIQIMALLQYNGVTTSFSNVLLAQDMQFVVMYALIIGIHQIIIGIAWYFYIFKHNKCKGRYFNLIIFCINYLFYVFYIINPIILIYTQYNGKYAALFSTHFSIIQYLALVIPLIFLSFMTYFACLYFMRKTHQSWKYDENENANVNENDRADRITPKNTMTHCELNKIHTLELDRFAKKRIMDSFNDECCCCILCNGKLFIDGNLDFLWLMNSNKRHSMNNYDHIQSIVINKHRKQQICRRLCVILFAIIFIAFGIFVAFYVFHHFINAMHICNNAYCQYKVYPFIVAGDEYICECRILRLYDVNDNDIDVNKIFTNFKMLEAVQIDLSQMSNLTYLRHISLNININSELLRIIDFESVAVDDIYENTAELLPNLQYVRLYNTKIAQMSASMFGLNGIQFIDFGSNEIQHIDCLDLMSSKLQYLTLSNNPINYTFECIDNLFSNPNVLYVNLFGNNIDIHSFPQKQQLIYNEKTVYYLQNNPICNKFEESAQKIKDYSYNLYSFLSDSNGCLTNNYCNFPNVTDLNNLCVPNLWNNNICDQQCNSSICFFDAYDCQ